MAFEVDSGATQTGTVARYEWLSRLEQETTKLRYTTFTSLLAVSFLVPGLAFNASTQETVRLLGRDTSAAALAFLLGFLFYLFTVVHYTWYHRYAHRYRAELKRLEVEMGIEVYRLRTRPTLGRMKFHFDWLLYILGLSYLFAAGSFAGWRLTLATLGLNVSAYILLLVWSVFWKEEPLEH
jgi:hypothetical protein